MKLQALSLSDLETVRQWRNESLAMLRTPFLLTEEMQAGFYRDVVCNRQANARYWAIVGDDNEIINRNFSGEIVPIVNTKLIGMCGLENISWENRNAEISIIIDPDQQRKGYGAQAVALLLDQGFNFLNLENIFGECYNCNPALIFWSKICEQYKAKTAGLPNRKYWNGIYWGSLYFNINKGTYNILT